MSADWPVHQPECFDAPISGRQWYSGCDPDRPRVGPDGRCQECGGEACPECGRENCPDCGPELDRLLAAVGARTIVLCDCGVSFSAPLRGRVECVCGSSFEMESLVSGIDAVEPSPDDSPMKLNAADAKLFRETLRKAENKSILDALGAKLTDAALARKKEV